MKIDLSLVTLQNSAAGNSTCALSLPFFPKDKKYFIGASLEAQSSQDWIALSVQKAQDPRKIYVYIPDWAKLLGVEETQVRKWNQDNKLYLETEKRARQEALKALPEQFVNEKILKAFQNSHFPSNFRDGEIACSVGRDGRVVVVDEAKKECWDLYRREPAVNWRGKIKGKTVQILRDGRRFEHIKQDPMGKGSWKVCKLAKDLLGNQSVARIVLKVDKEKDPDALKYHLIGLWILSRLEGVKGIVERYGDIRAVNKKGEREIVSYQRLYKHGNLLDFLDSKRPLTLEAKDHIAETLLSAMMEMHRRRIYHRDLKELNILLDDHPTKSGLYDAAICDFDLSWVEGAPLSLSCGTAFALAPERAHRTVSRTLNQTSEWELEKNDVWGMGLILYTLYHGHSLPGLYDPEIFNPNCVKESCHKIFGALAEIANLNGSLFFPTQPIDSLIWRMLQVRPEERLSSREALRIFREMQRF